MVVENGGVVALETQARGEARAPELMVAPVPAQVAMHIALVLCLGAPMIAGQDPHPVVGAEIRDRVLPDELVAPLVERRIHVPDGEDPQRRPVLQHGGAPRTLPESSAPIPTASATASVAATLGARRLPQRRARPKAITAYGAEATRGIGERATAAATTPTAAASKAAVRRERKYRRKKSWSRSSGIFAARSGK